MKSAYVVVLFLMLAACSGGAPATFNAAEVRDSVTVALRDYGAAWKTLDPNRIAAYFAADTEIRVVDGQTVYTSQTLRPALESFATTFKSYDGGVVESSIVVVPLSSTHAVATSAFEDIFTDAAGKVTTIKGAQMTVWTRQANNWRIVAMQTAPTEPVVTGAGGDR